MRFQYWDEITLETAITIIKQSANIAAKLSSCISKCHIWIHVRATSPTAYDTIWCKINYWDLFLKIKDNNEKKKVTLTVCVAADQTRYRGTDPIKSFGKWAYNCSKRQMPP